MSTSLVRPFAALRPTQEYAAAVIAPPYDVVSTAEARELADGRPQSFLHISRPEIDLPPGSSPYSDAAYAQGAASLAKLVDSGVLVREREPSFYVYRMEMNGHTQTGVAFVGSVAAYEQHRIRRHELTRPDKENDRVRNIASLNAQTGPVLLAYRANATLGALVRRAVAAAPLLGVTGPNDVRHTLWRIAAPHDVTAFSDALNSLEALYIADGHHRSAAAARVAAQRRGSPDASHEFFLCVAFPHDEMRILDYNRVVRDLNGLDADALLARARESFTVDAGSATTPSRTEAFSMYLAGRWYALSIRSDLEDRLLHPVLGIGDPRTDARIDFVGGIRGLKELERRVDGGRAAVAFALHPTRMEQLMAVADAGKLMPPKSTWFEPKLADGLLSHVLD
jgi:uncharacterized protein (DUF1015 family)